MPSAINSDVCIVERANGTAERACYISVTGNVGQPRLELKRAPVRVLDHESLSRNIQHVTGSIAIGESGLSLWTSRYDDADE